MSACKTDAQPLGVACVVGRVSYPMLIPEEFRRFFLQKNAVQPVTTKTDDNTIGYVGPYPIRTMPIAHLEVNQFELGFLHGAFTADLDPLQDPSSKPILENGRVLAGQLLGRPVYLSPE